MNKYLAGMQQIKTVMSIEKHLSNRNIERCRDYFCRLWFPAKKVVAINVTEALGKVKSLLIGHGWTTTKRVSGVTNQEEWYIESPKGDQYRMSRE